MKSQVVSVVGALLVGLSGISGSALAGEKDIAATFINEIHYDNVRSGTKVNSNDGIEIAGSAGTDLSKYTLQLYDKNGKKYASKKLSGKIDNEGDRVGAVFFKMTNLKTAGPVGIALVKSGKVKQFISYEGTVTAKDGAAKGRKSKSIGLKETSNSSKSKSLQLTGTGWGYADFAWKGPRKQSRGKINDGQSFDVDLPAMSAKDMCGNTLYPGKDKVRYCRNIALSDSKANVERAVIGIHGSPIDAEMYFDRLKQSRSDYKKAVGGSFQKTLIMVPYLLEDNDQKGTPLTNTGLSSDHLFWSGGWRYCNKAKNRSGLSSCGLIDWTIKKLVENHPKLKEIIVWGHSAGGQFVNRYAGANTVDGWVRGKGITIRYMSSAPGSYAMPNTNRAQTAEDKKKCTSYNTWPYGLGSQNTSYLNDNKFSKKNFIRRSSSRKIHYVIGLDDTDVTDTKKSNCSSWLQGNTRVDRFKRYRKQLRKECEKEYGATKCKKKHVSQANAFIELTGVPHSSSANSGTLADTQVKKILWK